MATLQFKNKREINAENYQDLAPVYLLQMAKAATLGYGEEFTTAEDFLSESGDGVIEDGIVELYDVVDSNNPNKVLYDCWVYLVDTATVFHAGTDTDTGVGMSKWSFNKHSKEADDTLAADLQLAFDTMSKAK